MRGTIMSDEDYDPQNKLEMLLANYMDAANELAECVKKNVMKDVKSDKKTKVALNQFIIAANEIDFLQEKLTASKLKLN